MAKLKELSESLQQTQNSAAGVAADQQRSLEDLAETTTHVVERSDNVDPDLALQRTPVPLTLHRVQFFPEEFWDRNLSLKYCPHVYRMQKVCSPCNQKQDG
jgi:hypothetical protein